MGKRNYLIEGVSGTGKSSVRQELRRRGYVAIDGDRELAYQGDPTTGEKTEGFGHEQHIWDGEKGRRLAANQDDEATFFCGGSRNFKQFIDLFDEIFILDVDAETLNERLDSRPDDDWGKRRERAGTHPPFTRHKRRRIQQWHRTRCHTAACQRRGRASFAMSELRLDSERPQRFVLIHFLICSSRSASFSFIRLMYLLSLLKHLKCFLLFIL
jgi:hypothetical protein